MIWLTKLAEAVEYATKFVDELEIFFQEGSNSSLEDFYNLESIGPILRELQGETLFKTSAPSLLRDAVAEEMQSRYFPNESTSAYVYARSYDNIKRVIEKAGNSLKNRMMDERLLTTSSLPHSPIASVQMVISTILNNIEASFLENLSAEEEYQDKRTNKKIAAWIVLLETLFRVNADYLVFLERFDNVTKLFKDYPKACEALEKLRLVIQANGEPYAYNKFWSTIFPRIEISEKIEKWKSTFSKQFLDAAEKKSLSSKGMPLLTPLTAEEKLLKGTLSTCLANINLYLSHRAQETRTGWKKFFSLGHFSAKDYYGKRKDWYLFLHQVTQYYNKLSYSQDITVKAPEGAIINELERLAQKYDKGRGRFSSLLRELKNEIDQGINNKEQLLRCLPIEKIIADKKVYSSQSNITHQLANHYAKCTLFSRKPALEEIDIYKRRIESSNQEFLSGERLEKLETRICLA